MLTRPTVQNASYIYGLSFLNDEAKEALTKGLSWDDYAKAGSKGHL